MDTCVSLITGRGVLHTPNENTPNENTSIANTSIEHMHNENTVVHTSNNMNNNGDVNMNNCGVSIGRYAIGRMQYAPTRLYANIIRYGQLVQLFNLDK